MVLHSCDNRRCVNPAHLFLGTQVDNMRDMAAKGRTPTKLTKEQVLTIREDARPQRVVAAEYGITQSTVWRIKHARTWFHI
jgi:DNA invertase Pin-like site-specific DNA recombinase